MGVEWNDQAGATRVTAPAGLSRQAADLSRRRLRYPSPVQEVAVVVNPISGSGPKDQALREFTSALEDGGAAVRVRPTRGPGDGAVIAREESAAGTDVVVAA